jgi:pimeloyl-ACP methyl ester carboxylesterase
MKSILLRLIASLALTAAIGLPGHGYAAGGQKVFLVRGFANVFSPGIDQLAAELQARGIQTELSNHLSSSLTASEAIEQCKSGQINSIVLVGHSLGAAAVIDIAKRLQEAGLRVALMVTLDPVGASHASGNVRRLENYYLSDGIGASMRADAGFHGQIENVDLARRPGAGHIAITTLPEVQKQIVAQIAAARGIACR